MGPVFHRLHKTENIVCVPQMFYLKIHVWKISPKAVVLSLFVTADRSIHDNFTTAGEYSMTVALFSAAEIKLPVWALDKAATVQSAALLHLQHSHFMLQCSHSMHPTVPPWNESTNHMPRYLPFRKGSVAIGNPERHERKASHCGSKQQYSSHAMITLLLLVRATYMYGVVLHAHPVRGKSHI